MLPMFWLVLVFTWPTDTNLHPSIHGPYASRASCEADMVYVETHHARVTSDRVWFRPICFDVEGATGEHHALLALNHTKTTIELLAVLPTETRCSRYQSSPFMEEARIERMVATGERLTLYCERFFAYEPVKEGHDRWESMTPEERKREYDEMMNGVLKKAEKHLGKKQLEKIVSRAKEEAAKQTPEEFYEELIGGKRLAAEASANNKARESARTWLDCLKQAWPFNSCE